MQKIKHILTNLKTLIFKTALYLLVSVVLILISYASYITVSKELAQKEDSEKDAYPCNTIVVRIEGDIVTYKSDAQDKFTDEAVANDILYKLDLAEENPDVKGLIIQIDSTGGSPVGSQEIANRIKGMRLPSVAVIKESGMSGGYWIASATNHIIASALSDVGSIGIVWRQLNQIEKDKKEGYSYTQIASGKYKAAVNSHLPLTQESKDKILNDLLQNSNVFIDTITENRGLERAYVSKLADGRSFTGTDALSNHLIDELGDFVSAKQYLSKKINDEVKACEY